jgi:hypothetical protein
MKKRNFALATLALILSSTLWAQSQIFPDVGTNQWFFPYVAKIKDWGIVNGNDDGTFAPSRNINRAEFSKMLTLYDERVDKKIQTQLEQVSPDTPETPSKNTQPPSILYLQSYQNIPESCPNGWEMIDLKEVWISEKSAQRRTCIGPPGCTTMELYARDFQSPALCPENWTEVSEGESDYRNRVRVCLWCPNS